MFVLVDTHLPTGYHHLGMCPSPLCYMPLHYNGCLLHLSLLLLLLSATRKTL